ncbi:hypothetical protein [Clostridium sp.]|uniref:hypothetical protein n=1 Tax=Clostridium sp. TaxID=1506 RepID=UPI00290FFE2B|nr:hypothetical protein [Clostridium sp.]MDU3410026.1 hypothetical protein [Clostridium sp.]
MERCCIVKDKNEIEYGIRQMLDRYWFVREKINKTSAYTTGETKERLELIEERKFLGEYLRMLGIQEFEIKSEWFVFNIE